MDRTHSEKQREDRTWLKGVESGDVPELLERHLEDGENMERRESSDHRQDRLETFTKAPEGTTGIDDYE